VYYYIILLEMYRVISILKFICLEPREKIREVTVDKISVMRLDRIIY
jgi:hypothetical protein